MYRVTILASAFAALMTLGSPTQAQDTDPPNARDARLGRSAPFATLGVSGAFGSPNEQFGLYVFWTANQEQGREKGFAVRRLSRSSSAGYVVHWATSFDCPGLEATIVDLEALPMPLIDVPTVGRDDRQRPPLDGVTYSLWSHSPTWPDAFGYSVQVSSNMGTPLAEWSQRLRNTLHDCWTDQMPAAV